ncbi:class III signal peptide-containing protein [Methanobrevibacter oralis]|uniref:Class III signal peptide n=1 Tax=Methanobrevibacter oralis TaxID=66851 RepID=A0A162FC89_METOA|nr:class III signal peptide-containing protein [Methanobrevibacter oralis]KZX10845.1 class III signal peptide [Methanobrevibacter oralis]
MYRKIDSKGQSSAELILIVGGLIVIVLFVGSYITNITINAQNSFEKLLNQQRNYLINKL